jgi:hypothetical protein
MLSAALALSLASPTPAVELYRQWKAGTTLSYQVLSHLYTEQRHYETSVFIPDEMDQNYKFTFQVKDVTDEGFATVEYKRPTIEIIEGETVEHPPRKRTEDLNEHLEIEMSPVNALTAVKDLAPKKPEKDGGGFARTMLRLRDAGMPETTQIVLGSFIGDLYRMALFIGDPETSVDFGPYLPLLEVEVGDTWKHTAAYQPQKLKDKKGKMAPQRIDYTYTYKGVGELDGKKVHQITAVLALDTDIAPYINDLLGMTSARSGLRGLKMKLQAQMEFDLDFETKHTLAVRANSTGSFAIEVTELPNVPVIEENVKGRTRLKLVSIK